jgi:hypothetical protein
MPDFAKAEISNESQDLTAYRTFLKRLTVGQTVSLPLEESETSRKVMRALNSAAASSGIRLARLPSSNGEVRFRVLPPEKRSVNISDEAKRSRVEKAKATREAHRQELAQLGNMGMGEVAAGEVEPQAHETTPARSRRRRQPAST